MSANTRAPSTIITITLTGQTDFNIPFEYLARKFVEVTLLGVDRLPLILNTDYRFVSKTMISLTKPYTADYSQLEIRRVTSASERLVDFHDGSILRAYDLNLSQIQTLHVAEEARDLTADTIGVNDKGHLDARGRKIVNVAYAEDGGDAIPLSQVIQWNDSALVSAIRAENAAFTAEAANTEANTAKDVTIANAAQTAADKLTTQADALITTNNVTLTNADVVKAEAAAFRAEAASAPATEVFNRLAVVENISNAASNKADDAYQLATTTEAALVVTDEKVAQLETWPKVINLSDIFEPQAPWGFNESEMQVVEFRDHYSIQGIFRTLSGSAGASVVGNFKNNVKFSFMQCGVSTKTPAHLERGWSGVEYGKTLYLQPASSGIIWIMAGFIVLK